jgi:hypothetical protein
VRVLLDHCVPRRFLLLVVGHEVSTAFEMGWANLTNGSLLAQASASFDVFVTVDQNVQFQQNLESLPLPVVVLAAPDNRLETLTPYATTLLRVLEQPLARELVRIEGTDRIVRLPARPHEP